MENCNRRCNTA